MAVSSLHQVRQYFVRVFNSQPDCSEDQMEKLEKSPSKVEFYNTSWLAYFPTQVDWWKIGMAKFLNITHFPLSFMLSCCYEGIVILKSKIWSINVVVWEKL